MAQVFITSKHNDKYHYILTQTALVVLISIFLLFVQKIYKNEIQGFNTNLHTQIKNNTR